VIALSVIFSGAALALTGIKPISIILAAQFANGLLLPIIAIFLLIVMNQKQQLGQYVNKWLGNTLGAIVVLVTAGLGIRIIMSVTGLL
jgi:manganese transport protein